MNAVKEQTDGGDVQSEPSSGTTENLLLQDVATLQSMLLNKRAVSTAACFAFFESQIYPAISKPPMKVPKIVRDRVGRNLLQRVSLEKGYDMDSSDLPPVSRISQLWLDLGLFQPPEWARLNLKLIDHICGLSISHDDFPSIESYENAMAKREALLGDLLGSWKTLNIQRFTSLRLGGAAAAAMQVGTPSLDEGMKAQLGRKKLPRNPLGILFPHHDPQKLDKVNAAAIATYVLLTDSIHSKRAVRQDAAPFLNAIARILSVAGTDQQQIAKMFDGYKNIPRYVSSRWATVVAEMPQISRAPNFHRHPTRGANIHRLVGEAWRAGNVTAVQNAFKEFYGAGPEDPQQKAELLRQPELFNYFIMAFMGMRQVKLALEVWNSMMTVGIEPTLKSWTAMMDGCQRARNPHAFKMVWGRLVESGLKLDVAIWTARISGLIALGEPDEGLKALVSMEKLWRERSDPKTALIAVKPSIEPVNAAVAGFLRLDRLDTARSILAWASKQGIEPDIFTFNTMLRSLVHQDRDGSEIRKLLGIMKAQNVEADVVTFTIIMEHVLTGLGARDPQEQIKLVTDLLGEMATAGAKANMMAYAKMVHILLAEGDSTSDAVKAVLAHIWGQGLELTSHIYTMLVEHYFSRDPPDVAAVTALIENRKLHANTDMDRVFWERVIKGYCQVADTARALDIFDKINKPGLVITFSTLHELLLALVNAGEMESAEALVTSTKEIRDAPELESSDENLRFWKHRFWHLAKKHHLLRTDLLTPAAKATGLHE